MKLARLEIEHVPGVENGSYSFADPTGKPNGLVLLAEDPDAALLQTIAALIEAVRSPAQPGHGVAWWARRHGAREARVRARWALSEGEAALAGLPTQIAASEWRLDQRDPLPVELMVDGTLPRTVRPGLARCVYLEAKRISIWMGADPLAELLAGIARQDVAAAQVVCRRGSGIVACRTPATFALLTDTVASVFPALRLERFPTAPNGVVCSRGGVEAELDELSDLERDAIHIAATLTCAAMRDGVVLIDRPDRHVPEDARGRWLDWLARVAGTNQLIMTTGGSS